MGHLRIGPYEVHVDRFNEGAAITAGTRFSAFTPKMLGGQIVMCGIFTAPLPYNLIMHVSREGAGEIEIPVNDGIAIASGDMWEDSFLGLTPGETCEFSADRDVTIKKMVVMEVTS